jgi:hypothetical protein
MTDQERIANLERQVQRLWEILDHVSIQAQRGESAWQMQQPLGGRLRKVPISPEFPDFGHFFEPDIESKGLRDRVK